ncbi:MAG TPA: translocation/assembly module TamB domain-containing protein [Holophaga sp.]|nr:translocation/assembly module TamB domain-containing protein [Holophaga sp.]
MSLRAEVTEGKRRWRSAWHRPWLRRVTYVLASGAVLSGSLLRTVRQPFFNRWLIARLDAVSRDQTGLGFGAQHLEVHPFKGILILERPAWGEDFFTARKICVQADFASLVVGNAPHVWNIEVEDPHVELDADRIARIRLKPHPESKNSPKWILDRFAVRGGHVRLHGAGWHVPDGEFDFRIYGLGLGPNRIQADLRVPRFQLTQGPTRMGGALSLLASVSESGIEVKRGDTRFGDSAFFFNGQYDAGSSTLQAGLRGQADLGEIVRFATPGRSKVLQGRAEFNAEAKGSIHDPAWTLNLRGRELALPASGVAPGELALSASGSLHAIALKDLDWHSSQGEIQASGAWKEKGGTHVSFKTDNASMAMVGDVLRAPWLKPLTVACSGELSLPGDPWAPFNPSDLTVSAEGGFRQGGLDAGHFTARMERGELRLDDLEVAMDGFKAVCAGRLTLNGRGLRSVEAEAKVETTAARVASSLRDWKIVDLDMDGRVKAEAQVVWDSARGLHLAGNVDVDEPRWHGAQADHLKADVGIEGADLRIENIALEKGQGSASGELWLTWRDLPPGAPAMDMCYRAFRLPIQEGLKAADVEKVIIPGLGTGWARIYGPYDHLRIQASAQAEAAQILVPPANGAIEQATRVLSIPAASGDMDFDLADGRIRLSNLRVAETLQQLGNVDESPSGPLALQGALDLNISRSQWQGGLKGTIDSQPLGLPGPRFQAMVSADLAGPWATAFGTTKMPSLSFSFNGGRLFLGSQSLEGLQGKIVSEPKAIQVQVGVSGHSDPFLALNLWSQGSDVIGALGAHVNPSTADTANLAATLTGDLLKDGSLDLEAEGRIDASGLHWKGRMENLLGRFDGFDLTQRSKVALEGDTSGLKLDLGLRAISTLPVKDGQAAIASPGQLRLSGHVPFSTREPMALNLSGKTELSNLKAILDHLLQVDAYSLVEDIKPHGTARFDLHGGGTFLDPSLDGTLSLNGGRLEILTYPQSVEDLSFKLRFKGRDIFLAEEDPMKGRMAQGDLRAWGQATWGFGGLSKYDFQARLNNFQLRDLPGAEGFELQGALDARLQGSDEEGGTLRGTIQADHMAYRAEIDINDVILLSAMGSNGLGTATEPDNPFSMIDLDLDVVLKEPWEFDTNLLKVKGKPAGAFKIQGTLAEPGLKGRMDIVPGGRLTNLLPAGDLVLEKGYLEFKDPRVRSPLMDLQGRVDIPDSPYVVNLDVRGGVDSLDVKMASTPHLRQEEIMSILIDPSLASSIGSRASSGSMSQMAMNSGLLATSSGLLTTLALAEFQDRMRRIFKLDRVNVVWRTGTGGNSETDITVGKTILGIPIVASHQKVGDVSTLRGQVEWRLGNFVIQLGASQSGSDKAGVAGEIRHTWVPRW